MRGVVVDAHGRAHKPEDANTHSSGNPHLAGQKDPALICAHRVPLFVPLVPIVELALYPPPLVWVEH